MTDVEWLRYMAEQYAFGDYADERKADYLRIATRYEAMEHELERLMDVVHEKDYDSIMLALGRKP